MLVPPVLICHFSEKIMLFISWWHHRSRIVRAKQYTAQQGCSAGSSLVSRLDRAPRTYVAGKGTSAKQKDAP